MGLVRRLHALAMILVGAWAMAGCQSATPLPAGPFRSELVLQEMPEPVAIGLHIPNLPPGSVVGFTDGAGASLVSGPISTPGMGFSQALISWNVDVPPANGARLEIRVGRRSAGGTLWSPFLFVTDWGDAPPKGDRVTRFDRLLSDAGGEEAPAVGRIATDYFTSEEMFDVLAYRVTTSDATKAVRLARIAVTLTDALNPIPPPTCPGPYGMTPSYWSRKVEVPFRSQRSAPAQIAARICSPTSLSMVMAYHGVDLPLEQVARRVYDEAHDIYGNWPRNVQAAYAMGVPGYLCRFDEWSRVQALLRDGYPIIASIKAEEDELRGAPYRKTAGHLLVIRGIDSEGMVMVNDPAAKTPARGVTAYRQADMERVWLRRGKGTAYVLLPRAPSP